MKLLFKADSALVQKHMDAFAALDTNGSGTIDYDEFARGFGFEDSPMLRQLFDLLDIHSDGRLDFREWGGVPVPPSSTMRAAIPRTYLCCAALIASLGLTTLALLSAPFQLPHGAMWARLSDPLSPCQVSSRLGPGQ